MNQFFLPHEYVNLSRKIKMIISGKSGTGKTWYALTAPRPLAILDLEGGSLVYHSKSTLFEAFDRLQTRSIQEIEAAVKSLESDTHYQSIVIDPITIYYELLQEAYQEKRILKSKNDDAALAMKDWGDIKKRYKSLLTRLINLDKNIIIITREKDVTQEVAGQQVVVGFREDCEKSTEYMPDISLRLSLSGAIRKCLIKKDRTITYQSGAIIELPKFETWLDNLPKGSDNIIIEPDDKAAEKNSQALEAKKPAPVSSEVNLPEEWSNWILRINAFRSPVEASNWWNKHKEEVKALCSQEAAHELYQMIVDKSAQLKTTERKSTMVANELYKVMGKKDL